MLDHTPTLMRKCVYFFFKFFIDNYRSVTGQDRSNLEILREPRRKRVRLVSIACVKDFYFH